MLYMVVKEISWIQVNSSCYKSIMGISAQDKQDFVLQVFVLPSLQILEFCNVHMAFRENEFLCLLLLLPR